MYTTKDKIWKFADVEFKGHQEDLTVMLPVGREKYTYVLMILCMPDKQWNCETSSRRYQY